MQIVGDLVRLPKEIVDLPLPWWHRSPLGLSHGTFVHLAILKSADRAVGDVVVSVLDPSRWDDLVRIEVSEEDKPGVVWKLIGAVRPHNIALAETGTHDHRTGHRATVILEPGAGEDVALVQRKLREALGNAGFEKLSIQRGLGLRAHDVVWSGAAEVRHGWLRGCRLGCVLSDLFPDAMAKGFDVTQAVISADTEQRALRFKFPRFGARTIRIHHRDHPDALEALTLALVRCELNVLSMLVRRGGAGKGQAMFIAVCEPAEATNVDRIDAILRKKLGKLHHRHWVKAPRVLGARPAQQVIYPRQEGVVEARVPGDLRMIVRDERRDVARKARGRVPVFLSRRFLEDNPRAQAIARATMGALERNGCFAVQALPEPGETRLTPHQVAAKMWNSKAAVVLVARTGASEQTSFSKNLAHEVGFMQGQGKPVLLLVEDGCADPLHDVANLSGIVAPRFAGTDDAFDLEHQRSLEKLIAKWVHSIRDFESE